MVTFSQETLPFDADAFRQVKRRLTHSYQWETLETEGAFHVFVRVPTEAPDPIAQLGRAVEEFPAWLEEKIGAVWLIGQLKSVHVPGFQANPLLRERLAFDQQQADDLRKRLKDPYVAFLYRAKGDPLRLVRMAVRIPRDFVADLDEEDLDGIAFAAAEWVDRRRDHLIQGVLLVANHDHLRITPRDFFADVKDRRAHHRPRAPKRAKVPAEETEAPAPEPDAFGLLDMPTTQPQEPDRLMPITPPHRKVEDVTALVELDASADADLEQAVAAAPMDRRLAQGMRVARWLMDLHGYRFEPTAHDRDDHSMLAYRDAAAPRRVLVRAFQRLDRHTARRVRKQVRAAEADHVLLVVAQKPPRSIRRLASQRIQVLRPEQLPSIQF